MVYRDHGYQRCGGIHLVMTSINLGVGLGLMTLVSAGAEPTFSFRSNKGVNTSYPTYYDPSKPYLNMAKAGGHGAKTTGATTYRSGRWVPIGPSFTFDASIEYAVNSNGYPTSLSTASKLVYYVATVEALHPSGDYVVKWDGSPTLAIDGSSSTHTVTSSTSNRIEFTWNGTQLVLSLTAVGSGFSNLVVCRAEDEAAVDAGDIFRPEYLAMLSGLAPSRGLAAIRTMDLNNTNYSADTSAIRPESFISWVEAPPSVCAKLAVALGADLWWCCPHLANSTYMADAAAAIFAVLDGTSSSVLLEFSNEHWNTIFGSYSYGVTAGAALGSTDAEKTFRWQAQQSLALWAAFEAAGFVPGTNQWNVFGGQAANGNAFTIGCPYNDPTHGRVQDSWHFGTVAAYVALNVDSPTKTSYVLGVSPVSDLFNTYSGGSIPHLGAALATLETDLAARISEIDTYGGHCILYEGGQHAVGVGSEQNDTSLTALLVSLQEMPEMATLYADLIEMIAASGAWFCCWYTACDTPDKFGAWGLCEDPMDTPLESNYTKYGAVSGYTDAQWWDETPPPVAPDRLLDTLTANFDHAYGFELLTGSYEGNALVRCRRSSDNAESDFSHESGSNFLDIAAIKAWSGSDSVYVTKFYDQIGVNHCTQSTAARQLQIINAGTEVTYGTESRLGGTAHGTGGTVSNASYYDTTSNITMGADSGYFWAYRRTSSGSTANMVGFQNKYQNGSGFHGQWSSDADYHRQDLSNATPSRTDTADRYGSTDNTTGNRVAVGRRNTSGDSDLYLNGAQQGTTHTSIGTSGTLASRLLAGVYDAHDGAFFFAATSSSDRPTDDDLTAIAAHFSTYYPD